MESGHSRESNPVVNLSKAVKEVQEGTSISAAAAKHNIPLSILFNRVSAIKQLKKKKEHCEMQSSVNEVPDKYGLVINEKLFRRRGCSRKNCIYVDQLYYNALHFALEGNTIGDTILNFKVKRKVLTRKLSKVKAFLGEQAPPKRKFRSAEKSLTMFQVMKILVENCDVLLPEKLISSIYYHQKGESMENVAKKFSFDTISFIKVVRMFRMFQKLSVACIKSKSNFIQSLLPSIHPSFSNSILTKEETLECLQSYCKKGKKRSYNYEDLKAALIDVENGVPINTAAKIYNIPSSTLSDHAKRKNLLTNQSSASTMSDTPPQEEKIIIASPQKSVVAVKSKGKKQPLCLFCHQPGYREEEIGKLHILNKVIVHYYCLLFSCALEQNGEDDEGILGFLAKDIIKEINRGKKLKCSHCGLQGATVGCSHKSCKKVYHFPCGLDNYAQFIFTDNFSSMCSKHRKFQNGSGRGEKTDCPICLESMVADPKIAVYPPCCKKSSWFHKKCIQKLALSAGYFFKCPLCNDKSVFTSEMLRQGIFVPDQDASWELVPNAYQELLERPIRCTASVCKCPSGRNSDEEGTRWEVLLCYYCGSTGIHIYCGNLKQSTTEWHCPTCVAMLNEGSSREQSEREAQKRRALALKRKQHELKEDEEDSDEDTASVSSQSKRKCTLPQQASSSQALDLDSEDDQTASVTRGIFGHIIIKELVENNEPLSDALKDMKEYAENISQKLIAYKIDKATFLNILNTTNSSSSHSKRRYVIDETHFQKFETCSLNYDQMRFLRNVFELGLALCARKTHLNSINRTVKRNPFCRKKRRYKDVLRVKDSLINLLRKGKSANLLEGNNTWSSYGNRQRNAYFNKVSNEIPSTSVGQEKISEDENDSTHSSREMESDQISEECLWCNMALNPRIHPTTVKLSTLTLIISCTSCFTDNIFHNMFASFGHTVSGSVNKNSASEDGMCISEDLDSKETKFVEAKLEDKQNQSRIQDYFTPLKKLELKEGDKEIKSDIDMKPGCKMTTSKDCDIIQKVSQDVKFIKDDGKYQAKKTDADIIESSPINENVNSSSTKVSSECVSTLSQSASRKNTITILNVKELESVSSRKSELKNFRSERSSNSNNIISSESNSVTKLSDKTSVTLSPARNVKTDDILTSKISCDSNSVTKLSDSNSVTSCPLRNFKINRSSDCETKSSFKDSRFAKLDDILTKNEGETKSTFKDSRFAKLDDILTKNEGETKSTFKDSRFAKLDILTKNEEEFKRNKSERNTNSDNKISCESESVTKLSDKINYSSDCETKSSVKDSNFAKSQVAKPDDKEAKNESKPRSSISSDTNKKRADNSSKDPSAAVIEDSKPDSINKSNIKSSSESIVNTSKTNTSDSFSSSLRTFRARDKSSSASHSKDKATTHLDSPNPRPIVFTREELLGNLSTQYLKPEDKTKSDKSSSSSTCVNIKNINYSPQVVESENHRSNSSKSTDPSDVKDTPQSTPPVHPPMSIISSSEKICKGCEISTKDKSLWKKSKIYCPCCKDVPTFCNQKHFDYFHSQIHHWSTIPSEGGILRPVRKCKVCSKSNYTRFYCPACPGKYGFCSMKHYEKNHPKEKSQSKSNIPQESTTKSSAGDSQEKAKSSNSNVPTLKTLYMSDLQKLKEKVVPQTLSLSAFKFPTTSRCIDIKSALNSTSMDSKDSLKNIRINRSSLNKEKQSSDKP